MRTIDTLLPALGAAATNAIGDDGATELAHALRTNTTLHTLIVGENEIGPDGMVALAEMLRTNSALTSIELSENCGGARFAHALARMAAENTSLYAPHRWL